MSWYWLDCSQTKVKARQNLNPNCDNVLEACITKNNIEDSFLGNHVPLRNTLRPKVEPKNASSCDLAPADHSAKYDQDHFEDDHKFTLKIGCSLNLDILTFLVTHSAMIKIPSVRSLFWPPKTLPKFSRSATFAVYNFHVTSSYLAEPSINSYWLGTWVVFYIKAGLKQRTRVFVEGYRVLSYAFGGFTSGVVALLSTCVIMLDNKVITRSIEGNESKHRVDWGCRIELVLHVLLFG